MTNILLLYYYNYYVNCIIIYVLFPMSIYISSQYDW